jgi:hypothetical protein
VVFSFEVRGRAGGTNDLAITLVEMADRDGLLLAVTTGSASVQVTGPSAAPTGIVLQPTNAPPGNSNEATATPASGTMPATAPPGATATAAQAPGATPIPVATQATGEAVSMPLPGATLPASVSPPAGNSTATALPATDLASEAGAAPVEAGLAEEPAAGVDSGGPTGASPDGEIAAATGAPAVIGAAAGPGSETGSAPPANSGAGDGFPVAIVIGGVALLGLAGILLARTRKRG